MVSKEGSKREERDGEGQNLEKNLQLFIHVLSKYLVSRKRTGSAGSPGVLFFPPGSWLKSQWRTAGRETHPAGTAGPGDGRGRLAAEMLENPGHPCKGGC